MPDYNDVMLRAYEREQEAYLDSLPKCEICGEPIQDDFLYDVGGDIYCESCMIDTFRQCTANYEREGK